MEEGYKAALVRFQLDQIKVTKEYQQLLGEKEAEVQSQCGICCVGRSSALL